MQNETSLDLQQTAGGQLDRWTFFRRKQKSPRQGYRWANANLATKRYGRPATDRQNPRQSIEQIYSRYEQNFEDSKAQPVKWLLGRTTTTEEMPNLLQFKSLTWRGRLVPLAL